MRTHIALSLLPLCALAPVPTLAEGAHQRLDCQVVTRCDGAGSCAPGGGDVSFTLSPEGTDAQGAGRYGIAHKGQSFEGRAASARGPFDWDAGGMRQSLYVNGDSELVWVAQGPEGPVVQFLNCEEG